MSDCRFGVSPVNYPDPDPDPVVSVSEQVGIRPMWNDMFLGSAVSVSEQIGI